MGGEYKADGNEGEEKNGTTVIAKSIKYTLKNEFPYILCLNELLGQ